MRPLRSRTPKAPRGQPITEDGRTLPAVTAGVVAFAGQYWQLLSGTQRQEPQSCQPVKL